MAGGGAGERSLMDTPTWAVAVVVALMVIISIFIEHGINNLGEWFQKKQKKAMNEALEKIKAELMLLGFISLLLTIGQGPISRICVPAKVATIMLPCSRNYSQEGADAGRRKLLWHEREGALRRVLAGASASDSCSNYGDKVSLISQSGIHQLHIFIFVLAVLHVLYSVLTVALAQAKMKKWKTWELETNSQQYQFSNDPSRFRFTHQTSFVRRHMGLSSTLGIRWIVAFIRQFFGSVTKVDYLTMRHGFINAHLSPNSNFNFHKYIKRSLEDDFKVVVGISPPLWILAIFILLLDINGYYTLATVSFVPLLVLLLVGTKLELVIMEMAQEIQNRTNIIIGAPVVEPSNKYFWFNRPQWILFLIHLTLFENAFQMSHFLWTWYEFSLKSCFYEKFWLTVVKVAMGIALQVLCSYITLPLYALVTQMGSHMKKAIFEEQTAKALKKWRDAAKRKKRLRDAGADVGSGLTSGDGEATPSRGSSPLHLLSKFKAKSTDVESAPASPRFSHSDRDEESEFEPRRPPAPTDDKTHHQDFSFPSSYRT
ncbi:MLO protein homolog 1-like [Zingiber officinale]|uniref:MLO protein homolog 1-like n=1 Tax=Zingiber officinale TaxID=94328 RepID=UPI001C4D7261|nr:MLO protein homolog 1-like [Zingiber officinale]